MSVRHVVGWTVALAAGTVLCGSRLALAQTNLILDHQTVTLGGVHTYGTVSLTNGSQIIVPAYNGSNKVSTGNLQIRANTITVDASSSIVADGKGYQPVLCDNGPGPSSTAGGRGGCAVLDSGGGGAHFGRGGRGTKDCNCVSPSTSCQFPQEFEEACGSLSSSGSSCVSTPGAPGGVCPAPSGNCYNHDALPTVAGQPYWHSIYAPEFGAAGGDKGCRDGWDSCSVGGAGGGRIVLAAVNATKTGSLSISGRVSANGKRGCAHGNDSGGGGAGGSILLVGDNVTVTGTASVSAAGGLGGDSRGNVNGDNPDCAGGCFQQGGTCDDCGGGGGGGIISVLSRTPAKLASTSVFNVRGADGGTCPICKGEAGGGAGELQLSGLYTGEFCDGFDNSFEEQVDEALPAQSCGTGACQSTVAACTSGFPNDCVPLSNPTCMAPMVDSRPRFMVIADSSGSMLTDLQGHYTFGDGSVGHLGLDTDGNGKPDDSRLHKAKSALSNVIAAYPEIDFALARYAQGVGQSINCQLAHWFECAGLCCTYDDPTNNTGTNPEGACTVTNVGSHAAVNVLATSKGEECINYAGSCGAVRRGADILVGFQKPVTQTLMWLDNKEGSFRQSILEGDHCDFASGGDCELRGTGPTPLADALYAVKSYLTRVKALDSIAGCRKYSVIMLTDGVETCQGNPVTAAAALLSQASIQTYVVGFSVLSSEQGSLNAIAAAGGTGSAYFAANETQLAAALASIVAKSVMFEKCNGLDDNCNGLCDENWPEVAVTGATCSNQRAAQVCNNGKLGVCFKTGTYVCKSDGSGAVCNAPDATGTAEICNGLDDDCDGAIDEDLPNCNVVCQPEICNGKDDDCDNQIDEDLASVPCGKDVGECKSGMTECVGGKLVCKGGSVPTNETCNGLDDDCDGVRDGMGEFCYSYSTGCDLKAGTCVGTCKLGTRLCTAVETGGVWSGQWGACAGDVGPTTEICDGLDNNCDGAVDETAECPGGSSCVGGACTQPCSGKEFSCPVGQLCKDGWCTPDPCDPVECDKLGWVCRGGECVDGCKNLTCTPPSVCVKGVCVDTSCYTKGCPAGQRCIQGECQPDPCAGKECGAERYCLDGNCVTGCETMVCKTDEVCKVQGEAGNRRPACVPDPCAAVICASPKVCSAGKCVSDPCDGVSCPNGQVCSEGTCVRDLCELVRCSAGYHCELGDCKLDNLETVKDLLASGGGGCACQLDGSSAGGSGPLALMLGLGALLIGLTRRMRRR